MNINRDLAIDSYLSYTDILNTTENIELHRNSCKVEAKVEIKHLIKIIERRSETTEKVFA